MAVDPVVGRSRSPTADPVFDELNMVSMLSGEIAITALVSACSLLAVWIPFYRGLKIFFEARAATRRLGPSALRRALREGGRTKGGRHHVKPISVLMLRLLRKSVREDQSYPKEFIIDATRQYVVNEYDANYALTHLDVLQPLAAYRVHRNDRRLARALPLNAPGGRIVGAQRRRSRAHLEHLRADRLRRARGLEDRSLRPPAGLPAGGVDSRGRSSRRPSPCGRASRLSCRLPTW